MKTYVKDGEFVIAIEQESDFSTDGGYTFETITNSACLNKDDAKELIIKLNQFVLTT